MAPDSKRLMGGHLVVGRDLQEVRVELVARPDVYGMDCVVQPGLLQHDVDLVTVGRGPGIEIDHGVACLLVLYSLRNTGGSGAFLPP